MTLQSLRLSLLQFLNRYYFRKEITYVILLKIVLLFLLWTLLPSEPRIKQSDLINHLMNKNINSPFYSR